MVCNQSPGMIDWLLELGAARVARPVLRGGGGSDATSLPNRLELQRAANHVGVVLGPRNIGMPHRRAETLLAWKDFQQVRMEEFARGMPLGDHFVCRAEGEIRLQAEEPCCRAIGSILGLELGRDKADS